MLSLIHLLLKAFFYVKFCKPVTFVSCLYHLSDLYWHKPTWCCMEILMRWNNLTSRLLFNYDFIWFNRIKMGKYFVREINLHWHFLLIAQRIVYKVKITELLIMGKRIWCLMEKQLKSDRNGVLMIIFIFESTRV